MRKYKVLHLLEWFELGGGLEQIAGEIACGLDKDKYDVEIWCIHRGGKLVDAFRQRGMPVRVLNIATYHNPWNILKLARLFKEARADIIHTHVYFASTIGRIAAKFAGVKVCINHVHSSYWHYSKANVLMERLLSLVTDKIICVSNSVRDFVVGHEKIGPHKVIVVHNGISRKEVNSVRPAGDGFVITTVASLFANKGHKVLLEAMALLKEGYPQIKCRIVGAGEMEEDLKKRTRELNLESNVSFLGVRWDVPEILTASDLFVLASIQREGLPVSILEAMAYGVAVIATRVGGVPEIIVDQENGCLVKPSDPQCLADCIKGLIDDESRRKRLAKAGQRTFEEHFEAKQMIAQIERVYEECLSL